MEFAKFEGLLLAFYTSKSIPIIGKLIGTLYIIRFECQQSSHSAHIGHSVHANYVFIHTQTLNPTPPRKLKNYAFLLCFFG